jgi:hypothetical protein
LSLFAFPSEKTVVRRTSLVPPAAPTRTKQY